MLTIEAEITPGMSAAEVVQLARLVEQVGFDRLGISDVPLYPDCFQLLSLCATATTRVQLGPLVTNPYSHHPVLLASAAATLQEVSQGRAFLGLGWGAGLAEIGIAQPRPVAALRESIAIINDLLAGKAVNRTGPLFHVTGAGWCKRRSGACRSASGHVARKRCGWPANWPTLRSSARAT